MIILLLFSFISAFACEIDKEMTIERILSRNKALPSKPHFEKYIQVLLTKFPLRQKHCGERIDSPGCLEKMRKLDIPTLIKIQNDIRNENDLIIHENSGKADIDEFVVKEFSEPDGRSSLESADVHRMPLIIKQMDQKDHYLNIFAVECREYLQPKQNVLYLSQYKLDASQELINFLRAKPIPAYDFFKSPFEETVLFLGDAKLSSEYFSLCLENVEKACAMEATPSKVCELKRTVSATAIFYSTYFHQLAYFESIREDGHRLYSSSGEKLMSKLILQTPEFVRDFNKCSSAR